MGAHHRERVADQRPGRLGCVPAPLVTRIEDVAELVRLQLGGFDPVEVEVADHPSLGPELHRPEHTAP